MLILDMETLKIMNETLAPTEMQAKETEPTDEDADKEEIKATLLQCLKQQGIRIITSGIEDSTLLTDAITTGTDYVIGNFVGETQDNLIETGSVESFELT